MAAAVLSGATVGQMVTEQGGVEGQWGLGEGSPGRGCTTRGGRQRHEGSWGRVGDWPGRTLAHLSRLPRL